MAEKGYDRSPDDDDDYNFPHSEDDDDKAGETFNFGSLLSSMPAAHSQEIERKHFKKKKAVFLILLLPSLLLAEPRILKKGWLN